MAEYLLISYLLSILGVGAYLLLFRKGETSLLHKRIGLTVLIFLSLVLPYFSDFPSVFESDLTHTNHTVNAMLNLNVVDDTDPELLACYDVAKNNSEFCHCEVVQKTNILLFKPNSLYNVVLNVGPWILKGFLLIGLLLMFDFILKLMYLKYIINSARKEKKTLNGMPYFLLYPKKSFPVSSFSFVSNYILWSEELNELPEEEQQAILYHELAHLVQKDTRYLLLLNLLKVFWWLNPAFYFIRSEFSRLSEFAADAYAVQYIGSKKLYANLLVKMKERQLNSAHHLTSGFGSSFLKARIVQLLRPNSNQRPKLFRLTLIVIGGMLWGTSVVALPILERQALLIEQYDILQKENLKTGKTSFCKACLIEKMLKEGGIDPK